MARHEIRENNVNSSKVIVVRIYLTESDLIYKEVMNYLKKDALIRGITVYRAITGVGKTGERSSSAIDLSLKLPVTVEFFDTPDKITNALEHLRYLIKPEHIVYWEALEPSFPE